MFAPPVATLNGALVQADHKRVAFAELHRHRCSRRADLDAIRNDTIQQPPPHTLLYLLLRHSMLLEYAAAASRLLINRGLLQPALRREPELVDLPLGQSMLTVWRAAGDEDHRARACRIRSRSGSICSASRPPANPMWRENPI